jgi:hypothetical protein
VYYVTGLIMKLYFRVSVPVSGFSRTYLDPPDLGQADIVVEKYSEGH